MKTPLFLAVSLATVYLAADKEPSGGSSGKTLKDQLADAEEARDKALGDILLAEKDRDEALSKISNLENLNSSLTSSNKDLQTKLDAAIKDRDEAVKERDDARKEKTDAISAKEKAEADLKTADDRAETHFREIAAKNGGKLPPKEQSKSSLTGNLEKPKLTGFRAVQAAIAEQIGETAAA